MDPKYLNNIKRKKKYITLYTDAVPLKRSKTKNKAEIQRQFIHYMKTLRKEKLKTDIAVQIITSTTDRRSPSISEWVKNIVDLMHKTDYLSDKNETDLLPFEDDGQIKYLYARYYFVGNSPSTRIKVQPFTGFISDLHLLNSHKEDDDDRDVTDRHRLQELKENKDQYVDMLSEEAYESMVMMAIEDHQKYLSNALSLSRHLITTIYPKKGRYQTTMKAVFGDWAEMLLRAPIRLSLPGIPKDGSSNKEIAQRYKQDIQDRLEEYKDSIPILEKIIHPMVVTILYRPAKGRDTKDIDNILLEYILPVVNTVFSPPASLYGLTESKFDTESTKIPLAKDKNGLSIGYEILKIPYHKDVPNGELFFGFKFDFNEETLMDQTENFIDEYLPNGYYF